MLRKYIGGDAVVARPERTRTMLLKEDPPTYYWDPKPRPPSVQWLFRYIFEARATATISPNRRVTLFKNVYAHGCYKCGDEA
jgi:hypothetical protein